MEKEFGFKRKEREKLTQRARRGRGGGHGEVNGKTDQLSFVITKDPHARAACGAPVNRKTQATVIEVLR
jgi:hypothetical protein